MTTKLLSPLALFFIFIFSGIATYAQGDLMVMPKRLVFEGSERTQEINLANTGNDTAVYAISFINYKMTESGNFEQVEVPEKGQRFATDFLRYFPRRVVLAPKEAQTVRIQLTRTGNLEPGEYRSHVYFRAVEEQVALGTEAAEDNEGISINIKTVFGISIPVIIREGESTTAINLTDVSLVTEGENPRLSLVINRSGNMSVYGNLTATHIALDGTETEVGMVKGVSVYTPNSKRRFSFELRNAENIDLTKGKLEIIYESDQGEVFARTNRELD